MTQSIDDTSGTRGRILAAAATALSEHGYARAHLADIAQRAQVQTPALYHYFESREDLIAAVMRHGQQLVREHVQAQLAALPREASLDERISTAVEAHLRIELELSDFARAVTRNGGHLPAHIRASFQADSEAFHEVWRLLLAEAQVQSRLRPGVDPTVGRMLVIGALNWATEWWQPNHSVADTVASAQSLVLHGLLQPE